MSKDTENETYMNRFERISNFFVRPILFAAAVIATPAVFAQQATVAYLPYIQLGDAGGLGATDQIIVAWQTNETAPNPTNYTVSFGTTTGYGSNVTPTARVVDNYLAADPQFGSLNIPAAYGPHVDYYAVLSGLSYATAYYYKVTGPGMPAGGFTASFNTRKTGSLFSFAVEGDEGYFPAIPNSSNIVNYEARIAHLINNISRLNVAGLPAVPAADIILNTGDNIYNQGSEDNYRDFFFPVLNSNTDSNETGAPILRSTLFFVADGNHDLGSTGVSANLLADNSAPQFSGSNGGGDALAFFNNLYYPLNGPTGADIQYTFNGDTASPNAMYFSYLGTNYASPAGIAAFRASTSVNTGGGQKRQIDHMSNYSFDYGNTHFLYLDANPHLFNGNLPGGSVSTVPPPPAFTPYPSVLAQWVANDLDSTKQTWKVVVYHQPAFSSGDATELNHQMRAAAKLLEDHGVNVVFNGHEHNYQRTYPIRATARTAENAGTTASTPAVYIDTTYDGKAQTVPN
ncbi:MAG: metallophosphoesterase, partial [Acidobacteriaceae bacterium]|nr:metallophosphoesterase [Acidobacteriaceae bacterium]